jgi:hypothetical protein
MKGTDKEREYEKNIQTREVLLKARKALMTEIFRAGESGGISRAQNYAPVLVDLQGAVKVMNEIIAENEEELTEPDPVADRMAALRAAKAAKKAETTSQEQNKE